MSKLEVMFFVYVIFNIINTILFAYNIFMNVRNFKYQIEKEEKYLNNSITITNNELNKMLHKFLDEIVIEQEKIKQKIMKKFDQ